MEASFKTEFGDGHGNVYSRYFFVPKDVSSQFLNAGIKRVLCTINEVKTIHSGLLPDGDGKYFILLNKDIQKELNLEIGAELTIHLVEDTSKYGMAICPELEELLEIDLEGSKYFHQLTPGKQRNLIHLATKPKGSDVRLKKSLIIIDYLKMTAGNLDFKELNECFKNWKNRY